MFEKSQHITIVTAYQLLLHIRMAYKSWLVIAMFLVVVLASERVSVAIGVC